VLEKGGKERLLSTLSFAVSFSKNQAFSLNYRLIILPETFVFPPAVKIIKIRTYRNTTLSVGLF